MNTIPEKARAITQSLWPLRVCKRSTCRTLAIEIASRTGTFAMAGKPAALVAGIGVVIAAGEEVAAVVGGDAMVAVGAQRLQPARTR